MNPLTQIKNQQLATLREVQRGASESASWHAQFKHSAYIFVGGLGYDLTEGDVLAVFAQYGEIVDVNLVRDKETGKSRGFAFVAYEDQRSTVLAVDNLSGALVAGRKVRVQHVDNYKKKRKEMEGDDGESDGGGQGDKMTTATQQPIPGRGVSMDGGARGLAPQQPAGASDAPWAGPGSLFSMLMEEQPANLNGAKGDKKESKKEKKHKKDKDKHKKKHKHDTDSSPPSSPAQPQAARGQVPQGPPKPAFGPPKPLLAQTNGHAHAGPPRPMSPPRPGDRHAAQERHAHRSGPEDRGYRGPAPKRGRYDEQRGEYDDRPAREHLGAGPRGREDQQPGSRRDYERGEASGAGRRDPERGDARVSGTQSDWRDSGHVDVRDIHRRGGDGHSEGRHAGRGEARRDGDDEGYVRDGGRGDNWDSDRRGGQSRSSRRDDARDGGEEGHREPRRNVDRRADDRPTAAVESYDSQWRRDSRADQAGAGGRGSRSEYGSRDRR